MRVDCLVNSENYDLTSSLVTFEEMGWLRDINPSCLLSMTLARFNLGRDGFYSTRSARAVRWTLGSSVLAERPSESISIVSPNCRRGSSYCKTACFFIFSFFSFFFRSSDRSPNLNSTVQLPPRKLSHELSSAAIERIRWTSVVSPDSDFLLSFCQ